jgi:hypothetical protein
LSKEKTKIAFSKNKNKTPKISEKSPAITLSSRDGFLESEKYFNQF